MAQIPLSAEIPRLTLKDYDGESWHTDIKHMTIELTNPQNLIDGIYIRSNFMTLKGTGSATNLKFHVHIERIGDKVGLYSYMVSIENYQHFREDWIPVH